MRGNDVHTIYKLRSKLGIEVLIVQLPDAGIETEEGSTGNEITEEHAAHAISNMLLIVAQCYIDMVFDSGKIYVTPCHQVIILTSLCFGTCKEIGPGYGIIAIYPISHEG